jgi:branched-chain amino acid transport system permease protein
MTEFLQQTANALALGSIYALVALGVAIIFSILRLANFAHGELMTAAGYTMYYMLDRDLPWIIVAPASVFVSILTAVALERLAYRPLRGARPSTLLLTSFAVSLILQNGFLLGFGARPKPIPFPDWVDAGLTIQGVRFQWLDLTTFAITVVILLLLTAFLRGTILGLALRSAADDFRTTRLMGIRANAVVIGAFIVSGALAGVSALFFFALTPVVAPNSGFEPMLQGFIATVIGGLGNLPAAVIGGFVLAFLQVGCQATLSDSLNPYVNAIVFAVAIVILQSRPNGIFGGRQTDEVRV